MRVLSNFDDGHPLLRALAAAGCPVSKIGPTDLPDPAWRESDYFYFGNIFEQIKTPFALARLRDRLARDQAPYVWWNRDAPWNCAIKPWRKCFVRMSRPADLHLAHSLQSADLFGEPVIYFPNAAETDQYHLGGRALASMQQKETYRYDVTFIGTLNPGFRQVRSRLEFLAALSRLLDSASVKYRFFDTSIGSGLSVPEQVDIIQRSRINLSVGAVCDDPVPSWGLPERCFGIAACGGFLLCDRRRHASDMFPPSVFADYSDVDECVSQIKYFLGNFDASRAMAEGLHHLVLERHTYTSRAQQLLQFVSDWKTSKSSPLVG